MHLYLTFLGIPATGYVQCCNCTWVESTRGEIVFASSLVLVKHSGTRGMTWCTSVCLQEWPTWHVVHVCYILYICFTYCTHLLQAIRGFYMLYTYCVHLLPHLTLCWSTGVHWEAFYRYVQYYKVTHTLRLNQSNEVVVTTVASYTGKQSAFYTSVHVWCVHHADVHPSHTVTVAFDSIACIAENVCLLFSQFHTWVKSYGLWNGTRLIPSPRLLPKPGNEAWVISKFVSLSSVGIKRSSWHLCAPGLVINLDYHVGMM